MIDRKLTTALTISSIILILLGILLAFRIWSVNNRLNPVLVEAFPGRISGPFERVFVVAHRGEYVVLLEDMSACEPNWSAALISDVSTRIVDGKDEIICELKHERLEWGILSACSRASVLCRFQAKTIGTYTLLVWPVEGFTNQRFQTPEMEFRIVVRYAPVAMKNYAFELAVLRPLFLISFVCGCLILLLRLVFWRQI